MNKNEYKNSPFHKDPLFAKDMSGSKLQRGTLKTLFSQYFSPFGIQAQKAYLPLDLANSPLKKQIETLGSV
jgi:hypothetical protein